MRCHIPNRQKSGRPGVKGNVTNQSAFFFDFFEYGVRKMKPGGRSRYCPFFFGENCLVAGFIHLFGVPPYIRRQRNFAVLTDFFFYVFADEPEYPATCFVFFNRLGKKIIREKNLYAGLDPLFGLYHASPEFRISA